MNENDRLKQIVLELAAPLVRAQGLEIWGLELFGAKKRHVRLFVDVPWKGKQVSTIATSSEVHENQDASKDIAAISASIDQCEAISRQLGLALDVEDCFGDAWVLEVSSPGLNRKFFELEQMRPFIGDIVEATLRVPLADEVFANRKVFRGILTSVDETSYTLEPCSVDSEGHIHKDNLPPCRIEWDNTRSAERMHIFEAPQKPRKTKNGPK